MKKALLLGVLICVAGCGPSYTTTPKFYHLQTGDKIAIEKFAATNPAKEQMIRASMAVELNNAGFALVDVNDNPDYKISGTITEAEREFGNRYVNGVLVLVTNKRGDLVANIKFKSFKGYILSSGFASPAEIGTEIGKKFVRSFKETD